MTDMVKTWKEFRNTTGGAGIAMTAITLGCGALVKEMHGYAPDIITYSTAILPVLTGYCAYECFKGCIEGIKELKLLEAQQNIRQ